MNSVALLLGVALICIGALILAKIWDVPANEMHAMNRAQVHHRHRNILYLRWLGFALIVIGIVIILAAFALSSPELFTS